MSSMNLHVCLEEWAQLPGQTLLGLLKDETGDLVYDENGPVRVIAGEESKYKTYEDFHGSEEWKEILWKLSESG